MVDKIVHKISDEDVSQEFLEKVLQDYYCYGDSCKGWETNVITQPKTVKNIVDVGASRIAVERGLVIHLQIKTLHLKLITQCLNLMQLQQK